MAYTLRKKRYCVKQAIAKIVAIAEICRNRKVPKRTLYRWIKRYKKFGLNGLVNQKIGRKPDKINPKFEIVVYKLWHTWKYGSPKMWTKLRNLDLKSHKGKSRKYTINMISK